MDSPKIAYEKITGTHRSLGQLSRLWLGPDHLLHVTSNGYTESYRRIYFRDIESITLLHTSSRLYIHSVLGLLAILISSVLLIADAPGLAYAIVCAVLGGLALWNHLKGATCRVVIGTAVVNETVKSLSRLHKTRQLLERFKGLILQAQSDLQATTAETANETPPTLELGPTEPPPLPT